MASDSDYQDVLQRALATMGDAPRALENFMKQIAAMREIELSLSTDKWLESHLAHAGPNNAAVHALGLALRHWDRQEDAAWIKDTKPITAERRSLAYRLLQISPAIQKVLDAGIPVFSESEVSIVIAAKHVPWYGERRRLDRFYWDGYCRYLRETKNWPTDAVASLDEATDSVVARLSDPCLPEAYQSKGLVVGYVQSGKTAHFTGVLAKAADAGYRLIIVLAGTLDILREQTQRRIDKELIGKELLDDEYVNDKDWTEFNSHGQKPSALGHFDWERLTGSKDDYQDLRRGIAALEFKSAVIAKPFFDPVNLRVAPVRLVVIKKNSRVISRLRGNLKRIGGRLKLVPALVVDDESDQASINTVNPDKAQRKERTAINGAITGLLKFLPRAQYVGYTATPFANALISPDDVDDLFPRDFMIALPRPKGYMGVSDFYDPEPKPQGFHSNERAFIRDVRGDDSADKNLRRAIDSFVLAGAIKLFRHRKDPRRFRFDHHTMLVHHSPFRVVHKEQAEEISDTYTTGGYLVGAGATRLEKLYREDFAPVNAAQASDLPLPNSFSDLKPFVGECLQKINQDKNVRIVNGDNKDDAPNFEKGPVWSILVGGAKLSRGYTVEGLTTTYYRRVATASDTLMQMGRWFGFRPGFRDLVRLFIGRDESIGTSGRKRLDLYEAFRALCLDEEEFRMDIRKYLNDGLTPSMIPPLIPSHLGALAPTARNKMYNAQIVFKNFGGRRIERTVAPTRSRDAERNGLLAAELLAQVNLQAETFKYEMSQDGNQPIEFDAFSGMATPQAVLKFLKGYVWESGELVLRHEIEFLTGSRGDPEINRWLILVPKMRQGKDYWPETAVAGIPRIAVRERARIGRRIKIFSEPDHVRLCNYLAGIRSDDAPIQPRSENIRKLTGAKTAVLLFYAVRASDDDFVTIGFALHFPPNHHDNRLVWTVQKKAEAGGQDPIVIDIQKDTKGKAGRSPVGAGGKRPTSGRALSVLRNKRMKNVQSRRKNS